MPFSAATRREFIRTAALAGGLTPFIPELITSATASSIRPPLQKVRLGFIGVGLRGRNHLAQALYRPDVEVTALCDIDPDAIAKSLAMIEKAGGRKAPATYSKGDEAFLQMLKRDDIDGVVIATPWEWHVPMAVATMKAGKYAGVEVSATVTLKESWDLVEAYEKTKVPCMILENVCYRRDVMAVLNMIRQGLFGEMTYAHCGYQHDLRNIKFNDGTARGVGVEFGAKGFSEAHWRTQHSVDRNGDLYPTHGLGPVAHWLNINRGNQFTYLTSTATKSRGLHKYVVDHGGANHPNAKVNFKLGDVVTTVIECANGENIVIIHDTNSPRPYSLGFRAQGTKGIWMDDGDSIYLEGVSPKPHEWEKFDAYQEKYDHPLWKEHAQTAANAGHGGIDFFVLRAFIESIKAQVNPPIDVYDAAAWSAISPLSEKSIAEGSKPQAIPDFTRGKWKTNKPIFALDNRY